MFIGHAAVRRLAFNSPACKRQANLRRGDVVRTGGGGKIMFNPRAVTKGESQRRLNPNYSLSPKNQKSDPFNPKQDRRNPSTITQVLMLTASAQPGIAPRCQSESCVGLSRCSGDRRGVALHYYILHYNLRIEGRCCGQNEDDAIPAAVPREAEPQNCKSVCIQSHFFWRAGCLGVDASGF